MSTPASSKSVAVVARKECGVYRQVGESPAGLKRNLDLRVTCWGFGGSEIEEMILYVYQHHGTYVLMMDDKFENGILSEKEQRTSLIKDVLLVASMAMVATLLIMYVRASSNQETVVTGSVVPSPVIEATENPLANITRPYELTKETKSFTSYEGRFTIDVPIDWRVTIDDPKSFAFDTNFKVEDLKGERLDSFDYVFLSPEDRYVDYLCDRERVTGKNCYAVSTISIDANLNEDHLEKVPRNNSEGGRLEWEVTDNPYWGYAGSGKILRAKSATHEYLVSVRNVDLETTREIVDSFRVVDFTSPRS